MVGHMTVIGADESVIRVKGEKAVVGGTDAATGEVLGLEAQSGIRTDSWTGFGIS